MMNLLMFMQHNWIVPVFVVFVLLVATTYWPGRKRSIERHGRIPLEDDDPAEPAARFRPTVGRNALGPTRGGSAGGLEQH